jgi:CHAD domain-containing protein
MAVELTRKAAATKETREILLCQIDKALQPLQVERTSDAQIHDARKQIKMARAALRLLRKDLPKSQYQAENRCLRDAARPLSEARDTAVLVQTFNHLLEGAPGPRGATRFGRQLAKERSKSRETIVGRDALGHTRRLLRDTHSRARDWRISSKGWSIIGAGVKKAYGAGRQALDAVRSSPSDTSFHEWRKQAKYLRYQLALLRALRPHRIEALAKKLHRLADCLGDDHDLSVLAKKLSANRDMFPDDEKCQQLRRRIDERRAALQHEAVRLGSRIYHKSPRKFRTRLHRYWRDWHCN